ncbi:VOC family protein [Halopelagius fulvigenes]|uniref:VOC family protein n=1 Tax=Halopelagius fulvigenes TaxID=1198324 RepID=A0ABD5TXP2_9EURY
MDVLHTAIWVSDLNTTKAFYCDGVGLKFSREFATDGVRNYFVKGENGVEIQFKYDSEHEVTVERDGVDHLAVGVDDVETTVGHLVDERGSEVLKPPTVLKKTGSTIAFVTDPDGYVLELVESA